MELYGILQLEAVVVVLDQYFVHQHTLEGQNIRNNNNAIYLSPQMIMNGYILNLILNEYKVLGVFRTTWNILMCFSAMYLGF